MDEAFSNVKALIVDPKPMGDNWVPGRRFVVTACE